MLVGGAGGALVAVAGLPLTAVAAPTASAAPAGAAARRSPAAPTTIQAENLLPGNPESEWQVTGSGDPSIQGYTTDISAEPRRHGVVQGRPRRVRRPSSTSTSTGSVGTAATAPARWRRSPSSQTTSTDQPPCYERRRPAWSTAAAGRSRRPGRCRPTAVSGIYIGRLVRDDTGGASHVPFVVRDDSGHSDAAVPDVRHDLAGLQHLRRQQPLQGTGSAPAARPTGGPTRSATTGPITVRAAHARGRPLQRRVPDAAVARAQRLRHELHDRRRHRPLGRRAARAPGVHVGRPRRVLVGPAAGQRRGRPRRRGATWPSSAATRSSGRPAGRASIDGTGTVVPHARLLQGDPQLPEQPRPDQHVDGHLARPARPARR